MFRLFGTRKSGGFTSSLYDQNSFYASFRHDLRNCAKELIIESPFITRRRVRSLLPILKDLRNHGVHIVINTRSPAEHEGIYQEQAIEAVALFHKLDIVVLYTGGHHRKLAIIDRTITWEGSLNILSHNDSCEIMRRLYSPSLAEELIGFIKLNTYTKR
jgi:phosphatidylserine/phosphatidylglycerophosphate/cardiolipin synthase-like enzyme